MKRYFIIRAFSLSLLSLLFVHHSAGVDHLLGSNGELENAVSHRTVLDLTSYMECPGLECVLSVYGSGIQSRLYPIKDYAIERVMYDSTLVYDTSTNDNGCIRYVVMTYTNDNVLIRILAGDNMLLFSMVGRSCVHVTAKEYHYALAQMCTSTVLNVNDEETTDEIVAEMNYDNGFPLVHYMAHIGFRIDRIVDDDLDIWSANESGSYCIGAVRCNIGDKYVLQIVIATSHSQEKHYYVRQDTRYTEIAPDKYHEILDSQLSPHPSEIPAR